MESLELWNRGMAIHFPSVVVFAAGRIVGDTIPGMKARDVYERLLARELAKR